MISSCNATKNHNKTTILGQTANQMYADVRTFHSSIVDALQKLM